MNTYTAAAEIAATEAKPAKVATLLHVLALGTPAAWDYVTAKCATQPDTREYILQVIACGPYAAETVSDGDRAAARFEASAHTCA